MRKILIIALIVLLLVTGYFMIFNGLNIMGVQILSVFGIKDKSDALDENLQRVSTLTSVDRPNAMAELNDSAKQLVIAKDEYNDKILYSSEEEIEQATQGIQFEMEYLWTKIGNHATKNGIVLKMEVKQSSSGVQNQYDLHFSATGSYVSISEFIAALENDSSLNFKIENTKVQPFEGNTQNLQAEFDVKEISIRIDQITSSYANSSDDKMITSDNNRQTQEGGNS